MTGPLFIIGAGVWVLCQVFGGKALNRLGIVGKAEPVPTGIGEWQRGMFAPNDLRAAGRGAQDAGKAAGQVANDALRGRV